MITLFQNRVPDTHVSRLTDADCVKLFWGAEYIDLLECKIKSWALLRYSLNFGVLGPSVLLMDWRKEHSDGMLKSRGLDSKPSSLAAQFDVSSSRIYSTRGLRIWLYFWAFIESRGFNSQDIRKLIPWEHKYLADADRKDQFIPMMDIDGIFPWWLHTLGIWHILRPAFVPGIDASRASGKRRKRNH